MDYYAKLHFLVIKKLFSGARRVTLRRRNPICENFRLGGGELAQLRNCVPLIIAPRGTQFLKSRKIAGAE